jgi:putative intracellular protease/amidase
MALKAVYVLIFDGFADWEPAYALAELRRSGGRQVVAVGFGAGPVISMGGLRLTPDTTLTSVMLEEVGLLLLPGGDVWEAGTYPEGELTPLLRQLSDRGTPIAAICGATFGLARAGLLNDRDHTSTVPGDLAALGAAYQGAAHYRTALAVADRGVITASGLGSVEFARAIFAALHVFTERDGAIWFDMYRHGRLPDSAG